MADRPRPARQKWRLALSAAAITLLVGLVAGELAFRQMATRDLDGNYRFRSQIVHYQHPGIRELQQAVDRYQAMAGRRIYEYHPALGWHPAAGSRSQSGIEYRHNAAGIRGATTPTDTCPQPGRLRIALFGDSFTYGSDAEYRDTWADRLASRLNDAGIAAEVLNFGFGAYGMDQAYLRWLLQGQRYQPDLVIFGLQMVDVFRHVYLLPPVFSGVYVPFAKPRFVLDADDELTIIGVPTPEPGQLVRLIEDPGSWGFAEHEFFWHSDLFRAPDAIGWWQLGSALWKIAHRRGDMSRFYDPGGEPARITRAIVERFRDSVAASGAGFLAVHLPSREEIGQGERGGALDYQPLLDQLADIVPVVPTLPAMIRTAGPQSVPALFSEHGSGTHYGPAGHQVVAQQVTEFLLDKRDMVALASRRHCP